jgi:2-C-methyl-D-erythritol 4-phosphate cytidylyltransferase / 2-C-methyl-D-erythritol 2,4-cyclodiphosphate synthase
MAPNISPDGGLVVLVVAAGRGVRAGGGLPKQYRPLRGKPLLTHTLEALASACAESPILCAIHPDDRALYAAATARLSRRAAARVLAPVHGGPTRQMSVRLGLEALALCVPIPGAVLIHDAARPFVSAPLIEAARKALAEHDACAPGVAIADAVKEVDAEGRVRAAPSRDRLRAMQTPQAFSFPIILSAHRQAAAAGADDLPDDVAVAAFAGVETRIFPGDPANLKITRPEDFIMAETRLAKNLGDVRVGQGFDVHAFAPGDGVWLGGVLIPHERTLSGHSDADVLMHAVTDALFGAIADGDIGSHFPPSDPQWKGAASEIFLRYAMDRVRARGGAVAHVDATIVCERPKVGPHRDAIRARLAQIMDLSIDRVAVKATTSERLGFTGRDEGIAAMATATVRLPDESADSETER